MPFARSVGSALCVSIFVLLAGVGCNGGGTWLLSMDDEVQLGRDAAAEFEKTNPVSHSAADTKLVKDTGAAIAAVAKPPNYPYEFRVIGTDTVNAVAFPGGRVYMYRGLLDKLKRDRDMVAWVMAHEVTHVAFRHSAKRIENQVGVQLLTQALLGGGAAGQVAGVVSELMFRDYGRDKELQADHQACVYAHKAGYDPTAGIGVVRVFQSLRDGKDPGKLELLFMTHPGDNTRINQVQAICKRNGYRGKYYP